MAHLVRKQTLSHTAVSIVQIPVWCLNTHRTTLVCYAMLRHICDASAHVPDQTADSAWCITCQTANWRIWRQAFTLLRSHALRIQRSVVDCITLRYVGHLDN